jgi:hypothetical protein
VEQISDVVGRCRHSTSRNFSVQGWGEAEVKKLQQSLNGREKPN